MKQLLEATIEEFEGGAWVADLVSLDAFDGTFDLVGDTWTGTMVTERIEGEHHHTRVVGGAGGLSEVLADKYYDGSVTVQVATQDVCRLSGETFGSAKAGAQLTTFERLRGPAYAALDAIALAFDLLWWIGRDGALNMLAERATGPAAAGVQLGSNVDSVTLTEPEDVQLGGTYDDKPIRHLRWRMTEKRTEVQIYFLPFLFRSPVERRYDSLQDAKVDRDNGDGTVDVIAAGRFGVTKVKLFCGVPHAKVKCDGGDLVTLGFFGGDPQKPFAVAMAQDTSATKKVGRVGDKVEIKIPPGTYITSVSGGSGSPAVGVPNIAEDTWEGTITEGTERLMVGD